MVSNSSRFSMKKNLFPGLVFAIMLLFGPLAYGQEVDSTVVTIDSTIPVLSDSMFSETGVILLGELPGWRYSTDDSFDFKEPSFDDSTWEILSPAELSLEKHINTNGYLKGWYRFRFEVDSTMINQSLFLRVGTWGATEIYIDGVLEDSFGQVSDEITPFEAYNPLNILPEEFKTRFEEGKVYTMAVRFEDRDAPWLYQNLGVSYRIDPWVRVTNVGYIRYTQDLIQSSKLFMYTINTSLLIILILIFSIYMLNRHDPVLRDATIFASLFLFSSITSFENVFQSDLIGYLFVDELSFMSVHMIFGWIPLFLNGILFGTRPSWMRWLFLAGIIVAPITSFTQVGVISTVYLIVATIVCVWVLYIGRNRIKGENSLILGTVIGELLLIISYVILEAYYIANPLLGYGDIHIFVIFLFFPLMLLFYLAYRYTRNFRLLQDKLKEVSRLSDEKLAAEREKQRLVSQQKQVLEKEVELRTADLTQSLENLRAAQQQLVQQEKLASLGQLTAGIAHEIKNPLNFVNNFSSVSLELIDEALEEIGKLEKSVISEDVAEILTSVKGNLTKIHDHGTRADRIVKSMLLHSRGGSGKMESSDFNAVVQEYTNLAYHGMRAGKNPISVDIKIDLDPAVGKVPLITEDFSRVILNLCNNAFDALRDRQAASSEQKFEAKLTVKTKLDGSMIKLEIEDNGPGIPDEIRDKILQPFFTTKKGTEGTGLGLSITNDIIKAHGGQLNIESEVGTMTRFIITLPK